MRNKASKGLSMRGLAGVPMILQMEASECGAACLAMMTAWYGKWISLETARELCDVSRDGSKAGNIIRAAEKLHMKAGGYRVTGSEALQKTGVFPVILFWKQKHFVVLRGFHLGRAYLNDPAFGRYSVSMREFECSFSGVCIMMEPAEGFVRDGKKRSMLTYAGAMLRQTKGTGALLALILLVLTIVNLYIPLLDRIFVDKLLHFPDSVWKRYFYTGLSLTLTVMLATEFVRESVFQGVQGKTSLIQGMSFFWRVMHLPVSFFSQRSIGDILRRRVYNESISFEIVKTMAPLVTNCAMMVFYLWIMLHYSAPLALIGVAAVAVNLFFTWLLSNHSVNISGVLEREEAELATQTVSSIDMIESVKVSGAESQLFGKWAGMAAMVGELDIRADRLFAVKGILPTIVRGLSSAAIAAAGVWMIMENKLTVGMLMAFSSWFSAFYQPSESILSAGKTINELRTRVERVEDINRYPVIDRTENKEESAEGLKKLTGSLVIRDLSFGYARLSEPLLSHISLAIEPGSSVAFVGPSGCGKSTLIDLITGQYSPWSGELLMDGKPLNEIDADIFAASVAVIDNECFLFADTIENNIKLWDTTIEDFDMILSGIDADLHEFILSKELGYQYRVTTNGSNLSGGQRQRLEIARILAQDPTFIILDEATDALDIKTEERVLSNIRARGITSIVISHRLSAIRGCDRIFVFDQGELKESGSHEELMEIRGLYYRLFGET